MAIFLAILLMVSSGDHLILPEPTWPVYQSCALLAGARVDPIHTLSKNHWNIDVQKVEDVCHIKPKLLVLCNPNNPTGKIFSEILLRDLTQIAIKSNMYILSDEVYSAYSSVPFTSILKVTDSHFIYVNSFSKKYGLTGCRIGYVVSDFQTIHRLQHLLQISVTCVPEFIQRVALKALKMKQDHFNDYAREMKQRIDLVCGELDKLPLSYVRPEGGMYVFPRTKFEPFDSNSFAYSLLNNRKVAIIPGEAFGNYPEHFRISLGTSTAHIQEGIQRIGKEIVDWQKK